MREDYSDKSSENLILSVVVPVTRMAGKLHNLDSWLAHVNDYPIQVIIVHDIQDSRTSVELDLLLDKICSDKISLIEGEFNSPGLARNEGILHAIGAWIAFWDSDDVPHLAEVFKAISSAPPGICTLICRFQVVSNETKSVKWEAPKFGESDNSAVIAAFPGLWRMIFRRDIIGKTRFREFHMAEDHIFIIEGNFFGGYIAFIDRIIYSYYIGVPGQLTSHKEKISALPYVISEIIALDRKHWSLLDLRLIARIILTAVAKGDSGTTRKTIRLIPRIVNTLGSKNSALVGQFQMEQLINGILILIKIGSGKIANAFKFTR